MKHIAISRGTTIAICYASTGIDKTLIWTKIETVV
jgi:hypothetical protein